MARPNLAATVLALAAVACAQAFAVSGKAVVAQQKGGRYWISAQASSAQARQKIVDAGVSLEDIREGTVSGIADAEALKQLQDAGVKLLQVLGLEDFAKKIQRNAKGAGHFHSYEEIRELLQGLAQKNQRLVSIFSIGQSLAYHREISAIRLNSEAKGSQSSSRPGLLFLGTHHGREHLSTEVALRIAQWLVDHYDKDRSVKKLLDNVDIFIVPIVNPDGKEHDYQTGQLLWHRKNMRQNWDGSLGVDLNRNYSVGFGGPGSSSRLASEIYHGEYAFSEPETRAVKGLVEAHDNLKIMVDFHAYSRLILYPWSYTNQPITDKTYLSIAARMAKITGYKAESGAELYLDGGDSVDWAYGTRGIYAFCVELGPDGNQRNGFYPGPKLIEPTFQKNMAMALYLMEEALSLGHRE